LLHLQQAYLRAELADRVLDHVKVQSTHTPEVFLGCDLAGLTRQPCGGKFAVVTFEAMAQAHVEHDDDRLDLWDLFAQWDALLMEACLDQQLDRVAT